MLHWADWMWIFCIVQTRMGRHKIHLESNSGLRRFFIPNGKGIQIHKFMSKRKTLSLKSVLPSLDSYQWQQNQKKNQVSLKTAMFKISFYDKDLKSQNA